MFKFSVKTGDVQKIEATVRKRLEAVLGDKDLLGEIGDYMVTRIKYQSRIGKPLNDGGKFKSLAPSTIKKRRYLEKYNETHSTYALERSNLTIVGSFLDSLKYKVKGLGRLEVFFSGIHPRYKGKKGAIGNAVANEDLATWLKDKGFAVFDKTIASNTIIVRRITSIVKRYIRRGL